MKVMLSATMVAILSLVLTPTADGATFSSVADGDASGSILSTGVGGTGRIAGYTSSSALIPGFLNPVNPGVTEHLPLQDNYFIFDVPDLTGETVISATLEVFSPAGGYVGGGIPFAVGVFAIDPDNVGGDLDNLRTANGALGDVYLATLPFATQYGGDLIGPTSDDSLISFALPGAIADVQSLSGGQIGMGMVFLGNSTEALAFDSVFGGTDDFTPTPRPTLVIETESVVIPEPTSGLFLASLAMGAGAVVRRRRK